MFRPVLWAGPSSSGGSGHLDVRCVGSLSKQSERSQRASVQSLLNSSEDASVKDFIQMMLCDDIEVTNKSDKDIQLKKLDTLSSLLQQLHQVSGLWRALATPQV